MNTFKKIANVFGWVVVVFLFCFGLYGGWQMTQTLWPGLHDDASLYSTVIINHASGNGNAFDVYARSLLLSYNNKNFNSHGQLYYPFVSKLLNDPSYPALLKLLHFSNLIGFLLAVVVFTLESRRSLKVNFLLSAGLGVVGGYGFVAVLQYLQGRPEHGIPFILIFFQLIVLLSKWPSMPPWLVGVQIGLVGAISPLPGIFLAFAIVFYSSVTSKECFDLAKKVSIQGSVALISWLLLYILFLDLNLINWFRSTLGGSEVYVSKWLPEYILAYWFKLNFIPGAAMIFLLAFCIGAWLFIKSIKISNVCAFFAAACACILLLLTWKFAVGSPFTHYCVVCFLPGVSIWCIENIRKMDLKQRLGKGVLSIAYSMAILFCLVLPSTGFSRNILLQNWLSKNEWSYHQTLKRIEELKSTLGPNDKIAIDAYTNTRSSVIFDRPPWKFISVLSEEEIADAESKLNIQVRYFLVIQFSHLHPPEKNGFRIVENTFNQTPVKIFGITIKTSLPGFGYALYERDSKLLERLE